MFSLQDLDGQDLRGAKQAIILRLDNVLKWLGKYIDEKDLL
jgi:hypothetical protein